MPAGIVQYHLSGSSSTVTTARNINIPCTVDGFIFCIPIVLKTTFHNVSFMSFLLRRSQFQHSLMPEFSALPWCELCIQPKEKNQGHCESPFQNKQWVWTRTVYSPNMFLLVTYLPSQKMNKKVRWQKGVSLVTWSQKLNDENRPTGE